MKIFAKGLAQVRRGINSIADETNHVIETHVRNFIVSEEFLKLLRKNGTVNPSSPWPENV